MIAGVGVDHFPTAYLKHSTLKLKQRDHLFFNSSLPFEVEMK